MNDLVQVVSEASSPTGPQTIVVEPQAKPQEEVKTDPAPGATEPQAVKPKKDSTAERLARIKAKEAALAEREKVLSEKESGLSDKEKAILTSEQFAAALKENPLKALEVAGLTFEQLTEAVLSQDSTSQTREALSKLGERLKTLEDFKATKEKEAEEAKIRSEQEYIDRTVADFKQKCKEFVQSKPDDYELLIANDAYDLVYEVIEEYWEKHGKMLQGQEAANAVEKWLEERSKRILNTKKAQRLVSKDTKEPEKTLTTKTGTVVPAQKSEKLLDREESLSRAAAMLRFN